MAQSKSEDKPTKKAAPKKVTKRSFKVPRLNIKVPRFLRPITDYFGGAWFELRQVRWTNRRATWGLTLAVIFFSIFFAVLILSLDTLFNYLFKEVLL